MRSAPIRSDGPAAGPGLLTAAQVAREFAKSVTWFYDVRSVLESCGFPQADLKGRWLATEVHAWLRTSGNLKRFQAALAARRPQADQAGAA